MLKHEKKNNSPLYVFRISEIDKDWLEKELTKIYKNINTNRPKDKKAITKSQILMKALRTGMKQFKAKGKADV